MMSTRLGVWSSAELASLTPRDGCHVVWTRRTIDTGVAGFESRAARDAAHTLERGGVESGQGRFRRALALRSETRVLETRSAVRRNEKATRGPDLTRGLLVVGQTARSFLPLAHRANLFHYEL
jgi:hypothetical protein